MITANLKYILLVGSLAALVFGLFRLAADGPVGETVASITFLTSAVLFVGAAVIYAIDRSGNGPPRDG